MDKITIAIVIILVIVAGIFIWSQFGGGVGANTISSAGQIAGGGCGV